MWYWSRGPSAPGGGAARRGVFPLLLAVAAVLAGCAPRTAGPPAPEGAGSGVWEASRRQGYTFRGIGQEPGWLVEIDPARRMHVLLDYGEREFFTERPERVAAGRDSTVYRAGSAGGPVEVTLVAEPCADIMSGEEFPASVALVYQGDRYEGCGRELRV